MDHRRFTGEHIVNHLTYTNPNGAPKKGAHSKIMKTHVTLALLLALFMTPVSAKPAATSSPSSPQALTEAEKARANKDLPFGTWVPGRTGFVNSPHAKKTQLVDVSGMAPGVAVKCPYSLKMFRVPEKEPIKEEIRLFAGAQPAAKPKTSPTPPITDTKSAKPATSAAKPVSATAPKKPTPEKPKPVVADKKVEAKKDISEKEEERGWVKDEPAKKDEQDASVPKRTQLDGFATYPFLKEGDTYIIVSCTKQMFWIVKKSGPDALILLETQATTGRAEGANPLPTPTTYAANGDVWYATIKAKFTQRPSKKYGAQMPWAMEVEYSEQTKEKTGVFIHSRTVWKNIPGASHGCIGVPEKNEAGDEVASKIYSMVPPGTKVIILGDAKKIADNGGLDLKKYVLWETVGGKTKASFKIQAEATYEQKREFLLEVFLPRKMQFDWADKSSSDKSRVYMTFAGVPELDRAMSVADFETIYADYYPNGGNVIVNIPEKFVQGVGSVGKPRAPEKE